MRSREIYDKLIYFQFISLLEYIYCNLDYDFFIIIITIIIIIIIIIIVLVIICLKQLFIYFMDYEILFENIENYCTV